MPEGKLGIVVIVLLAVLAVVVIGSAWLALGDSFRNLNEEQRRQAERRKLEERPPPPPPPVRRYTPERTRLRWYSPEIIAVLLLSVALGLWLARLVR